MTTILKRLMHWPQMWWRQAVNALGGCLRHLMLLFVGIPTLHVWASLLPEAPEGGPVVTVPPAWMDDVASDAAPSLLTFMVLIGVLLVVIDVILLGGRIGGFRHVLGERATRLAWEVWNRKYREDRPGSGPCYQAGRRSR